MSYQTVPGWDFYNDDNNPDDDLGHGTHIAGIIAAKANNLKGIAGIAYNAKILPLKACNNTMPEPGCPAYYVAASIIYAVDKGAKVINLSLGDTTDSSTVRAAVNYALAQNVVVVAAAGNTGATTNDTEYPAAYPGVISVGSHDPTSGIIAPSSTHNASVLVSAPGVSILSTWPKELDTTDGTPDGYTQQSGTSEATGFVSGTAALLMSANVAKTPATVRDALTCGAEDAGVGGRDDFYGYGRLKADMSMNWHNNSAGCKVTLANDNFENATAISTLPFTATQPINDRSVTEQTTDPQICGVTAEQTLWYKYTPTLAGYYQFTTLGSSYNPIMGIFRGNQGALTSVGCTTTSVPPQLQLPVPLDAAQTYYVAVGTDGTAVNNQVLQLRVNAAMLTNNLDYQESSVNIAYVGMWQQTIVTGASGGYTKQTTDTGAMAAFSFRGTSFDYVRTIGPDRGSVQIYINGSVTPITVSNQGAITKANQVYPVNVPSGTSGNWNTVYIIRDSAAPGAIDLDRIRTYDFDGSTVAGAITTKADDRDARLRYNLSADWTVLNPSPGAYLSTLSDTDVLNAGVTFRFLGNAVTIFRMTGASGFADMQVTIDNTLTLTVSNTAAGANAIRPYTIDGLTSMYHVVQIRKLGTTGVGHIQLDAVQGATLINLAAATTYDDRSLYIAYRGAWTDTPLVAGANAGTTRSLTAGSEASFKFTGNDLCFQYQRPNSLLNVVVDGMSLATIAEDTTGGGSFTLWCIETKLHKLLADTLHYAKLVAVDGTTVHTFTLDYVRPGRYNTITPARKLVQETDLSFRYGTPANWTTLTTAAKSPGGFAPQGGALKATSQDETATDVTITFYINGTGFILYTAVGPSHGCWIISVDDVVQPTVDLSDNLTLSRNSPLGYGVTNLVPGIHRIQLTADANCSTSPSAPPGGWPTNLEVDFDAIRVFP
jgi:hypothetical protein